MAGGHGFPIDASLSHWPASRSSSAVPAYRDAVSTDNPTIVRRAYERYAAGDTAAFLALVDPDVEWTYLDPAETDPEPRVCHGRHELEHALERHRAQGLRSEIEEVIGQRDRVVVVTRTPGVDGYRARKSDDRNIDVLTFRAGRVVAIRACHDREQALALAGIA